MDSWHSEWVIEDSSRQQLFTSVDSTQFNSTYNSQDYTVDSPDFSRDDSVESGGEEIIDKSDTSVLKPTFKSVLQAKKRLQAFSTAKQLRRTGSKDEKTEDGDKSDKTSPKKLRKGKIV
ncbi:hypothetical protein NQ314_007829 [Rhamnusium bicolor]|uniref:Uncharacterized protein n=1 Tax=Rhamnusium bicolor TaxID=1586634 RepID=A0AAV8YJ16_9CUCU|nr:hypothetical protein NQ314_007829 [Rhamnusium bicolor]